jgi:hypothetical protein
MDAAINQPSKAFQEDGIVQKPLSKAMVQYKLSELPNDEDSLRVASIDERKLGCPSSSKSMRYSHQYGIR